MGNFAKKVRRGTIVGPDRPDFDLVAWKKHLSENKEIDGDDLRVFEAGAFFDGLLSSLRASKNQLTLSPRTSARVVVALAARALCDLLAKLAASSENDVDVVTSVLIEKSLPGYQEQAFLPSELTSGLVDGLNYFFRDLLPWDPSTPNIESNDVELSNLDALWGDVRLATLYHCIKEYWHECRALGYGVGPHPEGTVLSPVAPEDAAVRAVSVYRRNTIAFMRALSFHEEWRLLPRKAKRQLCGIELISRIEGKDRIELIDTAGGDVNYETYIQQIAQELSLRSGPFASLLDKPLSRFGNATLSELIRGWRFLNSLAVHIAARPVSEAEASSDLWTHAPLIHHEVLARGMMVSLDCNELVARNLLEALTFGGTGTGDLWCQPLLKAGSDYLLVIPAIHSAALFRIVEGWMRLGGIDLKERGDVFEPYFRKILGKWARGSHIRADLTVVPHSFNFSVPYLADPIQIDGIVIVKDCVLIIEGKCILWPEDALHFANYRDTIAEGARQVAVRVDAVKKDYDLFREQILASGHQLPEKANIIGCVLTNSPTFSGHTMGGVAVTDLGILRTFFDNYFIKFEERENGVITKQVKLKFYEDAAGAAAVLEDYLRNPAQMDDVKGSLQTRELRLPVTLNGQGVYHRTFQVKLDVNSLAEKYGVALSGELDLT